MRNHFLSRLVRLLFVVPILISGLSARADSVIAISNGSLGTYQAGSINNTVAGGTVKLSVYLYDTAPAARTLTGYDLGFDLDAAGKQFSSNFTSFAATSGASLPSNFVVIPSAPSATNYDFLASASVNAPVVVNGIGSPIKLFDFQFQASPSTAAGLYDFKFLPTATNTGGLGGTININNIAFGVGNTPLQAVGGQFQINAVPEPTSLAMLGVVGLAFVARRFRKRKALEGTSGLWH